VGSMGYMGATTQALSVTAASVLTATLRNRCRVFMAAIYCGRFEKERAGTDCDRSLPADYAGWRNRRQKRHIRVFTTQVCCCYSAVPFWAASICSAQANVLATANKACGRSKPEGASAP